MVPMILVPLVATTMMPPKGHGNDNTNFDITKVDNLTGTRVSRWVNNGAMGIDRQQGQSSLSYPLVLVP